MHPFDLRLDALKAAYHDGSLTPRVLLLALRKRAAGLNPEFKLFIHLCSEAELEPYLAALDGKSAAELPLFGVPFAIKDNIDLAGIPTTAACPAFAFCGLADCGSTPPPSRLALRCHAGCQLSARAAKPAAAASGPIASGAQPRASR